MGASVVIDVPCGIRGNFNRDASRRAFSESMGFELVRELTSLFEEVSRDDGQRSEAVSVVDVEPGLAGTLDPERSSVNLRMG